MKAPIAIVMSSLLLAGCASTGGCPPLTKYTPEKQAKVAKLLRDQHGSDLADFIVDYGKLRDACRLNVGTPEYGSLIKTWKRKWHL